MDGLAIVISPLISLMKDQVDSLAECGIPAARLDSSLSWQEQRSVFMAIENKKLKLLYLAPERLVSENFLSIIQTVKLSFIAVDEAHCVSMWGHDFRPEYRQLGILKKLFPGITIAAFTATATAQVRKDIAEQLHLDDCRTLIGSFDRPNLIYRVQPRKTIVKQVCAILDKHRNESGIIYCIRRKDVDELCFQLTHLGYNAAPYHAGMTDDDRQVNQDMFIKEKVDIIVATVAFGMGIDKSNVRYVIHTGMPKSLEHYQQESGRAGRDGLEAECYLFYSGGDYGTWKSMLQDMPAEPQKIALAKLGDMYKFCTTGVCRHKAILKYFGQELGKDSCNACDICLEELDYIEDGLEKSQKIMSCIIRLGQRFGGEYTSLVLVGSHDKRIIENKHDKLSTYGLLADCSNHAIHDWIEQLAGQDYIERVGEYNTLVVTAKGWNVLRGQETPRLLKPAQRPTKTSKVVTNSWEGVDKGLFEALRKLRMEIAERKRVPAFVVFGDTTLRDLARKRPANFEMLMEVKGIGEKKCKQYGMAVLSAIQEYCRSNGAKRK